MLGKTKKKVWIFEIKINIKTAGVFTNSIKQRLFIYEITDFRQLRKKAQQKKKNSIISEFYIKGLKFFLNWVGPPKLKSTLKENMYLGYTTYIHSNICNEMHIDT